MMNLVDDQESEPIAERVQVTERALEGQHRDVLDAPLTVADKPYRLVEDFDVGSRIG